MSRRRAGARAAAPVAPPLLSLCLIVRDEEELLPGCLASIRGVVDELVVVDTGSTDRTVEIARAAGARVLAQPWRGDFSAPRNLAAGSARGVYLLQLDADERLAPGAGPAVRAAAARGGFDVGLLRLHNAARLDAPAGEVLAGRARLGEPAELPRLLRRDPSLRYAGVIHESVRDWATARGGRGERVDADIVHLGAVPELRAARGKAERNLALLRRRVELEPGDPTALGYLAMELLAQGRVDDAGEAAERGWALVAAQPRDRPAWRVGMVRGMVALARGDAARALATAEALVARDGPHPDPLYLRAFALELRALGPGVGAGARARGLEEAAAGFGEALARRRTAAPEQVLYASERDLLTRLALVQLARGAAGEALPLLALARAAGAGEAAVLGEAHARLLLGDPAAALRLVKPLLGLRPDGWVVAALAARALGAAPEAARFLAQARERAPAGFSLLHLRAALE